MYKEKFSSFVSPLSMSHVSVKSCPSSHTSAGLSSIFLNINDQWGFTKKFLEHLTEREFNYFNMRPPAVAIAVAHFTSDIMSINSENFNFYEIINTININIHLYYFNHSTVRVRPRCTSVNSGFPIRKPFKGY